MDVRVLICGGRDFEDRDTLDAALDQLHADRPITHVVTGAARGADSFGDDWAAARGVTRTIYPANWAAEGRAAGPIRNQRMLTDGRPDLVIAFPGGRGTEDMIRKAQAAGVPVTRPLVTEAP